MPEEHGQSRRWLTAILVFGIWTALGVSMASVSYLIITSASRTPTDTRAITGEVTWTELLRLGLVEWYGWALLALFVFRLARRFPFEQGRWLRSLLVHVPTSVGFAVLATGLLVGEHQVLRQSLPKPMKSPEWLQLFFLANLQENLVVYWILVGVYHALAYYRNYREGELRALQLEARLARAQLQVLKMQLHPHFLFNTLNAVSALMHQDVELADRMLARLGSLLRSALENADRQEVSLKEELDFIRPYLEIEQARLGARLRVQMDIEPSTMDAVVPNLVLQPLVENAIRHGVAPRTETGRVLILARRQDDRLCLQVCDDGPGLPDNSSPLREGVGLSNTRSRLQQLYGDAHRFELTNGQGKGLTASVVIPFREAEGNGAGP
jgi:sensor histidine kinase YesM